MQPDFTCTSDRFCEHTGHTFTPACPVNGTLEVICKINFSPKDKFILESLEDLVAIKSSQKQMKDHFVSVLLLCC